MPNLSLGAAITRYLTQHLGHQYTASQVTVYHHGQQVASVSVTMPPPPDPALDGTAVADQHHVQPRYFDLASLTKLYTSTLILRAISAGKATLNTPLADIIPEFAAGGVQPITDGGINPHTLALEAPDPQFSGQTIDPAAVTLFHLLTHTSGLAPWRPLFTVPPPPTQPDPIPRTQRWAHALDLMCSAPFIAPPGHAVRYSDIGFMLLGEAAGRLLAGEHRPASPNALGAAMRALMVELYGENPPVFYPVDAPAPAEGIHAFAPTEYDARWRNRRVQGEVHDENACGVGGIAGHAGLFGTADALALFGSRWASLDIPGVDSELAREATRQHAETDGERRGLGWMLRTLGVSSAGTKFGPDSYGHTGFVGNTLWIEPAQGIVVACLTNNVYFGRLKSGLLAFRVGLQDLIWEALCSS
jgi:CubicO group peptidase (beta-lactamase class C family)